MINAERIAEMKRLSAEATEGAWKVGEFETLIRTHDDVKVVAETWRLVDGAGAKDAQFIAESRQFVPGIIAAYEEQAEELAKAEYLHEQAAKDAVALHNENLKQASEIANLREALEFYANEETYDCLVEYDGMGEPFAGEVVVMADGGCIAKDALK